MSVRVEEIEFESGGRLLSGRSFRPESTRTRKPGVVFIHGLGSSQAGYYPRAEAVSTALGADCITFDLGGHGDPAEAWRDLTPRDHLGDLVAAHDVLSSDKEVDASRIGACGASYGAYLAALLVSERPVKRLLLRAPALYRDEEIDVPIGRHGKAQTGDSPKAAVLTGLSAFRGEVLVVESGQDCVIPSSVIERYVSSSPRASRVVIPEAGHALEPRFEQTFIAIILSWFQEL
jgi:pimeloyl-ACP methyl ester carboxylesterase